MVTFYLLLTGEVQNPTIQEIISDILNTRYNDYFWFFIPLFSVYLSLPVVTAISEVNRKAVFGYGIIAAFIIDSLLPFIFQLLGMEWNFALTIQTVSSYMLFVLAGYWMEEYGLSRKARWSLYVAGFFGLILQFVGTWVASWQIGDISQTFKGYFSPFNVLYACAVFAFFQSMNQHQAEVLERISRPFSSATFGIYMIHWFILRLLFGLHIFDETSIWFRTIGPVIVFLLCTIIVSVLQHIPLIKKTVPR